MAITSVTSSTSADALSISAKAQPDRTNLPSRTKDQTTKLTGGQGVTMAAPAEPLKPVVNAQGQKLGRIISTQA